MRVKLTGIVTSAESAVQQSPGRRTRSGRSPGWGRVRSSPGRAKQPGLCRPSRAGLELIREPRVPEPAVAVSCTLGFAMPCLRHSPSLDLSLTRMPDRGERNQCWNQWLITETCSTIWSKQNHGIIIASKKSNRNFGEGKFIGVRQSTKTQEP